MGVALEFRDPYVPLMESFGEPDEPFREIGRFSFVHIYHGNVRGQSEDNAKVFDCLAKVLWDDVTEEVCFETPDGQRWAQMEVTPVQ